MQNWLDFNQGVIWWQEPISWVVLAFGLLIGSFLNVCILRIPEKTFFLNSRSVCPHCQKGIPIYYNIPVFSWVMLRGKAACCGGPISAMYPLVEGVTGVLFLLVYWKYPFVEPFTGRIAWDPVMFIQCMHMLMFTALMIVVSVIDLRLQIIPDVISFPMIFLSSFWVFVHPQLDWFSSLSGVLFGGGILWVIAWVYYLVRKDYGLGFGDVKLLAAIGGWLGMEAVLPTLFLGSILGAIIGIVLIMLPGKKGLKTKIPFGPFLAIGALVHMFLGPNILHYALLF